MKNAMFIPDDPSQISTYDERSGKGAFSVVPAEIKGWNWGAAGLTWIWGISNRVWLSFFVLIPGLNYVFWIVLGINGSEWAWRSKKWASVESFKATQAKWRPWGITLFVLGLLFIVPSLLYVTINPAKGPFNANGSNFFQLPSVVPPSGVASLEGKHVDYTVTYDRAKWVLSDSWNKASEDSEYELVHRDGDILAELIAERVGNIESMADIALANAQEVAPDAEIVSKNTKVVNGHEFEVVQMKITVSGAPYFYYGYFFSGEEGTIQFVVACPQNLFTRYSEDITTLLNGIKVGG